MPLKEVGKEIENSLRLRFEDELLRACCHQVFPGSLQLFFKCSGRGSHSEPELMHRFFHVPRLTNPIAVHYSNTLWENLLKAFSTAWRRPGND